MLGFVRNGLVRLRRRPAYWLAVAMIVAVLVSAGIGVYRAMWASSDFRGFWEGGRHLVRTGRFSGRGAMERYPPTFHLVAGLFGMLPLWAAATLWNALNLASLAGLNVLLRKLMRVEGRRLALSWLIAIPFVCDNLALGQSGPMLLLLAVGGIYLARVGAAALGGAALGLAVLLKIIPAACLLVPAFLGRLRGVLVGVAVVAVLACAALWCTLGAEGSVTEFRRWRSVIAERHTALAMLRRPHGMRYTNQSVVATLARTFSDIPREKMRGSTPLARWPIGAVYAIQLAVLAVVAATMLTAVFYARRLPPRRAWAALCAMTTLVTLLPSPIVWTHYFMWWLPSLIYLSHRRVLVVSIGLIAAACLASVTLRGLGAHLILTFVLFFVLFADILARAKAPRPAAVPASRVGG